mmetsp:Transcript_32002/g.52861  ORF Transcript_32002/g.52861 Transcript_32002/m.52861 type:complete len:599 (+) Transcript_32002:122-1918(+)
MTISSVEPNPPLWPDSVKVIRPSDDPAMVKAILKETEDAFNEDFSCYTCDRHFSKRRLALLFAPGVYRNIDVEIGYYVQLLGLGNHPDQVQFRDCEHGPYVPALNKHLSEHGSSLDTFWRSAENFSTFPETKMLWAVSQAAPIRRVHVGSDLHLYDRQAYASGGFMANCQIDGKTDFGGQQQWLSRNCHFGNDVSGGAWSLVFVGCSGKVPHEEMGTIQTPSVTVETKTPILLEKPYVAMKDDGIHYELRVPPALKDYNHFGSSFDSKDDNVRDFSQVFVARDDQKIVVSKIQDALDDGKDIVLAAGTFDLEKSLTVRHDNQVILGIGLATLKGPPDGSPCIVVPPKIGGVRIAGVMLEASARLGDSSVEVSSLLEWGEATCKDRGDPANPGGLFDIFCRVGGDTKGDRAKYYVDCILRIHSGNVIGDNLWLWRADHAQLLEGEQPNFAPIPTYHQSEEDEYRVKNGIEVTGDDVLIYGLAVEHTNEHQTIWSGERGEVYFYQCELPYGARQASFGDKGYVGYLIKDHVVDHKLLAPGVYSNFRNEHVAVETAVLHPDRDTIFCVNPFTVHLDNNGGIRSVVNGNGEAALLKGTPTRL